ncbi:SURF1 family protein [Roseicyclus mahoneyensis]|uniref:SURF1-like protein n=1 Tax=Roseicyclus mahoneyensis TaxID=164332 RepID=A0A316GJI2_9RHOB|nr:SURF1 family protein [Roseicyclus mahoneyensis]PWK60694.1 surfeit locus 1 family protein [Roseicyclus mahoneyensis]
MGRVISVLVFGAVGVAILVSLGIWQMQRLAWKEAVLADIEARIAAAPVAMPDAPDPEAERYLPVRATGVIGEATVRILVSQRRIGAGYRLISALETAEGRRVLVDRGVLPVAEALPPVPEGAVTVTGNLHWPVERDGFTPENDLAENIWFARDVAALADHLGTEPLLLIAREISPSEPSVTPLPVTIENIPNDHLNYAITWFLLALVWLGMTLFLLWRIRQRPD